MSATTSPGHHEPLGTWRIIGRALALSLRHGLMFMAIAVPPWAIFFLIDLIPDGPILVITLLVGGLVLWSMTIMVLTQAAYRLEIQMPVNLAELTWNAWRCMLPFLACFTVASFAINFAYNFFIVPGIYVAGIFAVIVPVVVIENKGMNSIARCEEMTRRHRWSTGGVWTFLVVVLPLVLLFGIIPLSFLGIGDEPFSLLQWSTVGLVLAASVFNIVSSVTAALLYIRLLEIEDGYSRIEEVFE